MAKQKAVQTELLIGNPDVGVASQEVTLHSMTPSVLLSKAIEGGAALDTIERLIEMQVKFEAREAKKEFLKAFSKFQSIAPDLVKNKKVDFGEGKAKYKYQELADIALHIRPALEACGLAYRWTQVDAESKITVTCVISHVGGHEEAGEPLWGLADGQGRNNIQAKASTISYLRRYTLTGILGLSSADGDNDGKGGAPKIPGNDGEKPVLAAARLQGALKAINAGETTLEKIQEQFDITESQYKTLEVAQKNFNSRQ